MANNIFANITKKGTIAQFSAAMDTFPNVWQNHAMTIASDVKTETHVWAGFLPTPREFISGRNFQGIRDFTFDRANKVYELSFKIDRVSVEDDQHSEINSRISEAAEAWATFKDSQFATLLINGETSTDTFDATTFHDDTRTIGASGTIDNSFTAAITPANDPSVTEIKAALKTMIQTMDRYNDDQGRPFNAGARNQKRLVIPPEHVQAVTETVNNTLVNSGDTNAWAQNIVEIDELVYLTDADDAMYMSYTGASRMPFIYQERTPLEIIVDTDPVHVAKEDGVIVMCRQRYSLGYGEPRRNCRYDFT